jgi:hypothetical protein
MYLVGLHVRIKIQTGIFLVVLDTGRHFLSLTGKGAELKYGGY